MCINSGESKRKKTKWTERSWKKSPPTLSTGSFSLQEKKDRKECFEGERSHHQPWIQVRFLCITKLRHFFLCHAAIELKTPWVQVHGNFVCLLYVFYLLGVYICCCTTFRLWIDIIVSFILFVSLLFATQAEALFLFPIICKDRVCPQCKVNKLD